MALWSNYWSCVLVQLLVVCNGPSCIVLVQCRQFIPHPLLLMQFAFKPLSHGLKRVCMNFIRNQKFPRNVDGIEVLKLTCGRRAGVYACLILSLETPASSSKKKAPFVTVIWILFLIPGGQKASFSLLRGLHQIEEATNHGFVVRFFKLAEILKRYFF